MLIKLKKIISYIFVFLAHRICLSVLKCGGNQNATVLDLNQQQHTRWIYIQVTSFLPGKDNLMLIQITGASVKFIGSKYIQESFINMSLGPVYMEWGTQVQWGWFLLFSRSVGHKAKETYPTRPGSPTPCKQGLRACLHGVGDPGLVGLVSFVFTLWGTQNKRNLPHQTGVSHSM